MPFSMKAYWAGVGTVVLALTAGFGGGTLIADLISSDTAIPAPGTSRLERVMAEKRPKRVASSVETTGNVLAEAVPVAPEARQVAAPRPEPANEAPEPAVASVIRPEPAISHALQNTAMDTIASPGAGRSAASERQTHSVQSRAKQSRKSDSKPRDVIRRENVGSVRYVIRSPGGREVSAAEIEMLKRRLRAQRERQPEEIRADALAYQPERRRVIDGLFD